MFTAVFTGCTAQEKKEDTTVANTAITLLDEGIISQEEYDAKKKQLLGL